MKHKNSIQLARNRSTTRGDGIDFDPRSIPELVPLMFACSGDSLTEMAFDFAGYALCANHMQGLQGSQFLDLWSGISSQEIYSAIEAACVDGQAAIIGSQASTPIHDVSFETLLLPFSRAGRRYSIYGIQSPHEWPASLGSQPLSMHQITSIRIEDAEDLGVDIGRGNLALFTAGRPGRRVGHLVVVDGGRG